MYVYEKCLLQRKYLYILAAYYTLIVMWIDKSITTWTVV